MATSVFKGAIGTGQISAEFLSDFSNVDADLLIASYASVGGGGTDVDRASTAPGGKVRVRVNASAKGLVEILVATGQSTDSGRLRVLLEDGTLRDDEPVLGSVRWVYGVE